MDIAQVETHARQNQNILGLIDISLMGYIWYQTMNLVQQASKNRLGHPPDAKGISP